MVGRARFHPVYKDSPGRFSQGGDISCDTGGQSAGTLLHQIEVVPEIDETIR